MRCKHCGHDNQQENFFCGHCGSPLFHRRAPGEDSSRDFMLADVTPETTPSSTFEPGVKGTSTPFVEPRQVQDSPVPEAPSREFMIAGFPARSRNSAANQSKVSSSAAFPEDGKQQAIRSGDQPERAASTAQPGPPYDFVPRSLTRADDPISGPSFLGLANASGGQREDLDYLYEDEDRHGSYRWIVGVAILAAFAVFLAYQWKQFPSWYSEIVKPLSGQPAQQAQSPPPANSTGDGSGPTNPAATSTPPVSNKDKGSPGATTNPNADKKAASAPDTHSSEAPSPEQNQTDEQQASNKPPANTEQANSVPQSDVEQDAGKTSKPSDANDAKQADGPEADETQQRPSSPRQPEPRDSEADQLLKRGQAFLYGTGVPRSCSQAVTYLQNAARLGSAKANSQLGGLFATGHCVELDRARAYDYFTRAQDVEHGRNVYVQHNREMLWSQMTPAEKARARQQMY